MFRTVSDSEAGRHSRRSMRRGDLIVAWIEDRLPIAVRSRVNLGARELGLIALVAALGLVVAGVLAFRSSAAAATSIGHSARPTAPLPPSPSTVIMASAAPTAHEGVVVDVAGKVAHPGVHTLPPGSRVFEAIKAAGGAKKGVDTSSLNLARVLVDGEQIVVGAQGVGTRAAPLGATSSLVSLNQADVTTLEQLPGIGPVMAATIVSWRSEHGGFTQVEELQEIPGIGPKTFAKLKPLVRL